MLLRIAPRAMRAPLGAARWILDTIFPSLCPGCGDELSGGWWLCPGCRRSLRRAPPGTICLTCRSGGDHRRDREAGMLCRDPEHADFAARAVWWMESPLDVCIHQLKYEGRLSLAEPFGRALARRLAPPPDARVVPVPLHGTRRRERGYNQAALVARGAARRWNLPVDEGALARTRRTRAQARLGDRERAANVWGAFVTPRPERIRGGTWILVDDVATTGATLASAIQALREAGAARVIPLAVALA